MKNAQTVSTPIATVSTLIAALLAVLTVLGPAPPALAQDATNVRVDGHRVQVGAGSVTTFARFDRSGAPLAIGLEFAPEAAERPPAERSDLHNCTDIDQDGTVEQPDECRLWHEFVIPLPDRVVQHPDLPFRWVLLNWNPEGHIPHGVYSLPHFDVHFVMAPIEDIFSIDSGACGPEYVRCDQFERAVAPVPPNYVHPDFQNVDAVAPSMGNHLIDLTGPEFQGEKFTRTWIYGAYEGHITFYEEMVTQEFLLSRPDRCYSIKQPEGFEQAGSYPTTVCHRYDAERDRYQVVMEEFRARPASPPAPVAATEEE